MTSLHRLVCLLLVTVGAVDSFAHAQTPQTAMPPAAMGILAAMEKEVAISKTKAITSLEKVLKDTTKRGDLAGAVAVKDAIDQLKSETQGQGRAAGGRAAPGGVVGRWTGEGYSLEFLPDGTGRFGTAAGRWRMEGNTLHADWSNGWSHRLNVTSEGLVGAKVARAEGREEPARLTRDK